MARRVGTRYGDLLATLLATLLLHVVARAAQPREYDVKAAYIFNFVQFVTWPPGAFATPSDPLRICTSGGNPFGDSLAATLKGERVNGHPLAVSHNVAGEDLLRCHVVFVAGTGPRVESVLRSVARAPVLTIGENETFMRAGGIVQFLIVDGRVRFDVNARQAAASGLSLSARLLQVARHVEQ